MAERAKAGSGRKFSITIQVPDDVAAEWPQRSTAEKLIHEVYAAMGGSPAAPGVTPRVRPRMLVIAVAGLFVAGLVGGYLGARGYQTVSGSRRPPATVSAPQPAAEVAAVSSPPPVAVPPPESAPPAGLPAAGDGAPTVTYRVQVGAFRQPEYARDLVQRLQRDGFRAEMTQSGRLTLVLLGRFRVRADAERFAAHLKARRYDAFVTRQETPK